MNGGSIPMIPVRTRQAPKDAAKDPNAKHYAVVLRSGLGHQVFTFSMDGDVSAGIAALFLALQYFPRVDRLEVYRKGSGDPNVMNDVGAGICHVPLAELLKFAAPLMEKLTGFTHPALGDLVKPVREEDQEELERQVLDRKNPQASRVESKKKRK